MSYGKEKLLLPCLGGGIVGTGEKGGYIWALFKVMGTQNKIVGTLFIG